MRPSNARSVHRGDRLLKRIDIAVTCAGALLIIPTVMALHAHLPFGWAGVAMLIAFALELIVAIVIAIGQRCGLVGTELFKTSSTRGLDDIVEAPRREPPPFVRKAEDALPSSSVMTPRDTQAVYRANRLLKRINTSLKWAMFLLLIPAGMAAQARLPFAGWVIAPALIAIALYAVWAIVITIGERCGLVDRKLLSGTPLSFHEPLGTPKREPTSIVRKPDDTLPPRDGPIVQAKRIQATRIQGTRVHVAHIPGRGDVRYRIG